MAPMGIVGLVNADGSLSARGIDYYIERARGGVGLIITGVHKVESDWSLWPGRLLFLGPLWPPLPSSPKRSMRWGTKIFVQLTAGFGRVANPSRLRSQPVSASAIPNYWRPDMTCLELTTAEVETWSSLWGCRGGSHGCGDRRGGAPRP